MISGFSLAFYHCLGYYTWVSTNSFKQMTKSLILASASPRRATLLTQLGLSFSVAVPDIDESLIDGEAIADYAKRLAGEKAQAIAATMPCDNVVIIAADTCGEIKDNQHPQLLGKPTDKADAVRILSLLSGQTHHIHSAFAVFDGNRLHREVVTSSVTMKSLSHAEILAYWHTGEPADKAGAYAIQGLGAQFVKHLSGSYSAVMGLPLYELSCVLADYGIDLLEASKMR